MAAFDANESLTPFKIRRDARDDGRVDQARVDQARVDQDYGAILCDVADARQVAPEWFLPAHWGDKAQQVTSGGRGGAWFVDTPAGPSVLRLYLRGGWAAGISRDAYLWRGADRVRSFQEFRLTRSLHARGLPVPRPIAACYRRHGLAYRAAILVERLHGVHTFAERVAVAASDAPWEETGRLIARFHRAGLDHADLNAHNILFDADGHGWLIDFDKGRLRIPATRWRERNLARLRRSLLKLGNAADVVAIDRDFERLRGAYHATWARGF